MINKIYNSKDLNGEILIQPLKKYRKFVTSRDGSWKDTARTIIHVISALFAYPLLGTLASIQGLLIKIS